MNGIERIAAERERQVTVEGFTAEHDEEHIEYELVGAAISYARHARNQLVYDSPMHGAGASQEWRWSHEWWKPSDDPIRNLEKAGALIAAEIDRLLAEEGRETNG